MRRGLTWAAVAGLLAGAMPAYAEPVTVWLEDEVPDDRAIEKADLQTGGTLHLDSTDVQFPPQPLTEEDAAAITAVGAAVEDGKDRWDDYEVEQSIAAEIQDAVDHVGLVRDARDRDDIVRALLFEGAAIARGFSAVDLGASDRAEAFRFGEGPGALPKAWVDAYALSHELADRSDLVDGTGWNDYQRFAKAIQALEPATVYVDDDVGEVWVDGVKLASGNRELPPGRHWFHTVRGGVVHGRQVVDLAPGAEIVLPRAVTDEALATAHERVAAGRRSGMPDAVEDSLSLLLARYGGPMFVGALKDGKPVLVSYDDRAQLKDTTLVTVQLFGEVGGGVLVSPLFEQNYDDGSPEPWMVAPAASGGLGFEVGVSYFQFGGGIDASITPGRTIKFADGNDVENGSVSVFPQPWGGIGAYFVRPTKPTPIAGILGTVTWLSPANLGVGGRLMIGIPVDDKPTWVRISLGASYGLPAQWTTPAGTTTGATISGFLRIGLGSRV